MECARTAARDQSATAANAARTARTAAHESLLPLPLHRRHRRRQLRAQLPASLLMLSLAALPVPSVCSSPSSCSSGCAALTAGGGGVHRSFTGRPMAYRFPLRPREGGPSRSQLGCSPRCRLRSPSASIVSRSVSFDATPPADRCDLRRPPTVTTRTLATEISSEHQPLLGVFDARAPTQCFRGSVVPTGSRRLYSTTLPDGGSTKNGYQAAMHVAWHTEGRPARPPGQPEHPSRDMLGRKTAPHSSDRKAVACV